MTSKHLFKLGQMSPHDQTEGGFRIKANKQNFPMLQGMSLYKLVLHPDGIREPHWHANADELGYCLAGEVLVNMYDTGDTRATFVVQQGDAFLIPSGALHHIENIGKGPAELILQFSSDDTEDFNLSSTLGVFSDNVLGNTWNVKGQVFRSLERSSQKTAFATLRQGQPMIPQEAYYKSSYRYSLDASQPLLINEGGSARMARHNVWPIVQRQALYSLLLTGQGMREPHWHPETAELGYVKEGRGRMSIFSASGAVDTYIMEAGDIYFIPKAYPHHIENLNNQDLHLLIFFDQAMPRDIGFTGSVRSFSNDVLASTMHCEANFFEQLSKYYVDQFIVGKVNPVDPS